MCLTSRNDVALAEASGFKIFTRDGEGLLQSVFTSTFREGLKYSPNRRIRVDPEEATFFAFEKFENAISIAREGRSRWNMVRGGLIVLPVTLFEVVATGKYHVPSDDIQCMDGYYPAFQSKEIIVHDNPETRSQFHDEVLTDWLKDKKYGMSAIEKEAFRIRVPHLAAVLK